MELCYLASISVLEEILPALATPGARYALVAGDDMVTVVHYGTSGLINQFAFPVVMRIPELSPEDGTMILMVATERSKEWESFWLPLENKMPLASVNPLS